MERKRIARYYAEALFYTAQKRGEAEEMGEIFASLKSVLADYAELQKVLSNPLISSEEKGGALKTLLPKILGREKEEVFTAIASEYQNFLDKARDIEAVEVTVAAPLSPALEMELEKRLTRLAGKQVRLEIKLEPKILAGLILCWGDRVIDASVRKKLELLGAHLKADWTRPTDAKG